MRKMREEGRARGREGRRERMKEKQIFYLKYPRVVEGEGGGTG